MSFASRLRELDERVIPDRRRYDAPKPFWFRYGPIASALLTFATAYTVAETATWWKLFGALPALAWVALAVAVMRWSGQHRLSPQVSQTT